MRHLNIISEDNGHSDLPAAIDIDRLSQIRLMESPYYRHAPGALHTFWFEKSTVNGFLSMIRTGEGFIPRLSGAVEESQTKCYAWALMPNCAPPGPADHP
jgi:hypothetical protein